MIVTNVCSVLSLQGKIIHKTTATNMFGNKFLLWIAWIYSVFKRFLHIRYILYITKTITIYTNRTKSQKLFKM